MHVETNTVNGYVIVSRQQANGESQHDLFDGRSSSPLYTSELFDECVSVSRILGTVRQVTEVSNPEEAANLVVDALKVAMSEHGGRRKVAPGGVEQVVTEK